LIFCRLFFIFVTTPFVFILTKTLIIMRKSLLLKNIFLFLTLLVFSFSTNAITLFVSNTGNDATGDGTIGNPYATIQFAINQAVNGDEIIVADGYYYIYSAIDFSGKEIFVHSMYGGENCMVECDTSLFNAFNFISGETNLSILEGFQITGGDNGVYVDNSSPIIRGCAIFENNQMGIYVNGNYIDTLPTPGQTIIERNLIFGNGSDGIQVFEYCSANIDHNTIEQNGVGGTGSGITIGFATVNITNNIITNNLSYGMNDAAGSSPVTHSYNDVWNNSKGDYGILVADATEISADPMYVDPANGDFSLQSGSPCIDAGDPVAPQDPDGTTSDLGILYFDQNFVCNLWLDVYPNDVSTHGFSDGSVNVYANDGVPPFSFVWNTGDTTNSIYNLPVGLYSVTVTDFNGCQAVDSIFIDEPPCEINYDVYNYNVSADTIADGSIDVYPYNGVSPYQFIWNTGDTNSSIYNLAVGEYSFTITDFVGCTTSGVAYVNNQNCNTWLQSYLYHPQNIADSSGRIEVFVQEGTPPFDFIWSNGATTQIIDNLGVGDYSVTVTDAAGCITTDTYTLYEMFYNCNINGDFNWYSGNNGCQSLHFEGNAYNQERRINYEWDMGDGNIIYDSIMFDYTYANPGTYTVRMTATDAYDPGCTFTTLHDIDILPELTGDFTTNIVDSRVNYMPNILGGSGNFNINWDFGDGYTSNFWNPEHVYANTGEFVVSLYVEDNKNYSCSFEFVDTIIINALDPCLLVGYFYKPNPVTDCFTYNFNATVENGGNPYQIYWDFGDASDSTNIQYFDHSFPDFGVYNVCMTVTDTSIAGCEVTFCDTVRIDSIWGDFTYWVDEYGQYNFDANGFGGNGMYSFDWDFGDGYTEYNMQNISHYYYGAGAYPVTLTIRDANNYNCFTTYTQNVFINDISADVIYSGGCPPQLVTFSNKSQVFGSNGPVYFEWWLNDFHFVGDTLPEMNLWGGDYHLHLEAFDDNGSMGSYDQDFWISGSEGRFYISSGDEACPDEEVKLDYANWTYWQQWYVNNELIADYSGPVSYRFQEGVYDIMFVYSDDCGTDTLHRTLTVTPTAKPQVNFFIEGADRVCPGDQVKFNTESDYLDYFWEFGDNLTAQGVRNPGHVYQSPGEYQVVLTATNICGNSSTDTMTVWVVEWMEAYADFSFWPNQVCPGEPVNLEAYGSGNFYWDFGDGGFSTKRTPVYAYADTGMYQITLNVTNGCGYSAYNTQQILVNTNPYSASINAQFDFKIDNNNGIDTLTICPGSEVFFENWSWADGEVTYLWDFGDGSFANTQQTSHIFEMDGLWEVQLILSNTCMASDTAKKYVRVDSGLPPLAQLQIVPDSICPGEQVFFFDDAWDFRDNHNYYTIWFGDGDSVVYFDGYMDSLLQVQFVHSYNTVGTYSTYFEATNLCGNSVFVEKNITVDTDTSRVPFYYISNSTQDGNENQEEVQGDTWIYEVEPGLYTFLNIDSAFYSIGTTIGDNDMNPYIASFGGYLLDTVNMLLSVKEFPGMCDTNIATYSYIENFDSVNTLVFTNLTDTCSERISLMTGGVFFKIQSSQCPPGFYWDDQSQTCIEEYQDNLTGCPGDPVGFYIVGGESYEWHFNGGFTTTEQYPFFVYDTVGIYDEFVVATNSCNRIDTLYTTVEIDTTNVPEPWFHFETVGGEPRAQSPIRFVYDKDWHIENVHFLWEFSDGGIDTVMNPIHIFANEGEYWVRLTVTNGCGSASETQYYWMAPPPFNACDASFTFYVDTTQTVYYSFEGSDNITNWQWKFGDGTQSNETNPAHTYTNADFYNVCLNVFDSVTGCVDQFCQVVPVIDSTASACYANFEYYVEDNMVYFYNLSEGNYSRVSWNFGDNTTSQNFEPVHAYNWYDYFYVCLQVFDETTGCFSEYCDVIEVLDTTSVACKSNFEFYVDNRQVYFTNLAEGSYTDIQWDFGDGTYGYNPYPAHFYVDPGYYEVCLAIYDSVSQCFDNTCQIVEVVDTTTVSCNADFSFFVDSLTVHFNNKSEGQFTEIYWDFGDGSNSFQMNPVHTYDYADYYEVYLGVYDDTSGCFDDYWTVVPVIDTNQVSCKANFDYYIDGNNVIFSNLSEGDYTHIQWDFGDGAIDNIENPRHLYLNSDYFQVCLSVFDSVSQCFDEFCEIIAVIDTNTVACKANFGSYISGTSVVFNNQSEGNTTDFFWNFDDGTYSYEENPSHDFAESGYYTVCLTVYDSVSQCMDDFCKELAVIDSSSIACKADFSKYKDNLTVYFTSESNGNLTNYLWDFGDGTYSYEENPVHTYDYSDYYEVCLTVLDANSNCTDDVCKVIGVVDTTTTACNSSFTFYSSNLDVVFTNESEGNITNFLWDFGDGSYSYDENPSHSYDETGYYDVCLTVLDEATNCVDNSCQIVIVIDTTGNSCNADFTSYSDNLNVIFTNKSEGNLTDYLWDFGDGSFSYEENPTHAFEETGYYDVILTVYDETSGCLDDYDKYVVVIDTTGSACRADYDSYTNNLQVIFTNTSEGNLTDYFWDFGDGYFDYDANPVHSYDYSGYYDVCLSVYDETSGCLDEYCSYVVVIDTTQASCRADFSNYNNNKEVRFENTSDGNITDYFWDFGDGYYAYEENPVHTYDSPDYYDVTLSIYDEASGCLDEFDKIIIVIDTTQAMCNASFGTYNDNLNIHFTNESEGDITDYFWDFGDGYYAYEENPVHVYDYPDYYSVSLSVYDQTSGCIDEFNKVVVVYDSTAALCHAEYENHNENLNVYFTNKSTGDISDYFWSFGDGYYSYEANPTHTYTSPDYYEVGLSVYDETSGCLDDYYNVVVVIDTSGPNCQAGFDFYSENTNVSFTNSSTGDFTDVFWDFGDGYYSSENNPVHSYSDPGYYDVWLTIYDQASGCLDDQENVIVVVDTTATVCKAEFSSYTNDLTVNFDNSSVGTFTDYFWDFGDGYYAFDANTSHTYTSSGYYEVSLTVYDETSGCLDDYSNIVFVYQENVATCNAQFSSYTENNTVFFTSEAIGDYTSIFWDFDDGFNSNVVDPTHVYTDAGYYNVCLTVIDTTTDCFDTRCDVIFVAGTNPDPAVCKADFSYFPDNTTLTVSFTDESYGDPNNWYWDFGDNTPASTDQNPTYTYTTAGYYNVALTIRTDAGCLETFEKWIAIGDVTNSHTAYFTYFEDSLTSTAHFNNLSLGSISAYYWDFGDGYSSEQEEPAHTYQDTGYYAVCLTTWGANTGDSITYCNDIRVGNSLDDRCLFSCVWPGDANNDLEANHYDIMTIGLNYGLTGPPREDASINWWGQFGQDWSTFQTDGTNNKHGDCNGDGIINLDDTLAIRQNFAYSHYYQPDKGGFEWVLSFDWDDGAPTKASARKGIAMLSPPSKTKTPDIYGIGYEIEVIGGEGIIFSTIQIDYSNSWFGTDGDDMLTFFATDSVKQMIYIGMTRIDHADTTGNGEIVALTFNFIDGHEEDNVSFNVTTTGGMDASGVYVSVGEGFMIDLGSDVDLCQGESVVLDAGAGYASYVWSNGGSTTNELTVTESGTYSVIVTNDNGINSYDTVTVTVHDLPVVNLGDDIQAGGTVTLDAGAGFASYLWSDGSTGQTLQVTESGTYSVTVTNEWGCEGSDDINITITGIEDINGSNMNITLYPNPNKGLFNINISSNQNAEMILELTDLQGKIVYTNDISKTMMYQSSIDVSDLADGVYYLKVIAGNSIKVKKLIINK